MYIRDYDHMHFFHKFSSLYSGERILKICEHLVKLWLDVGITPWINNPLRQWVNNDRINLVSFLQ